MESFEVVNEMSFMLKTLELDRELNKPAPVARNGVIWHYSCETCNHMVPQDCTCPPTIPVTTESLQIQENL